MIKVPVNETLTTSLIKRLFLKYNTNDLCIVLKNTKINLNTPSFNNLV